MMPQNQVCWQPPLDEVGLLAFDLCCGSRWAVWALVAVLSKALSLNPPPPVSNPVVHQRIRSRYASKFQAP